MELKSRGENGKGMKLETRLLQGKGEKEAFDNGIKFRFFVREDINLKKTFSFGHCVNEGGGLPMPEFFGPFFTK